MAEMDPGTLITVVTIVVTGFGIAIGTITATYVEGRAVERIVEGMVRQPELVGELRNTLILVLALLETASIYVLLVMLILLFANPLLTRFFPVG